jgi:hypothetical protein
MARALADPDPDSANWVQAWGSVSQRADADATLRWAAALLADPQPDVRQFAASVVQSISFDQKPRRTEALVALRARLPAEPDADVLVALIMAFAAYHGPGDLPEIVAHAQHPDRQVRRQVAADLVYALMDAASAPAAVGLLIKLGRDRDGTVRTAALRTLRDHAFDSPATGELLIAGRDDSDPGVRLEALTGLARGGDRSAFEELRRLADEAGTGSPAWQLADDAARWLQQRS